MSSGVADAPSVAGIHYALADPQLPAIAWAVRPLSPVIITTRMPAPWACGDGLGRFRARRVDQRQQTEESHALLHLLSRKPLG